MRSMAVRFGCALWTVVAVAVSGAGQARLASSAEAAPEAVANELIYAAQDDGTVHVYDIDHQHSEVKQLRLFSCCADIRGITAAVATHRLYVMYNRNSEGHVASIDLLSDQVLWDRVVHTPGVDRGDVSPDGSMLYVPTWEDDPGSAYELALDAETGTEQARILLPPRSHDTIVSLDGKRIFMETKTQNAAMYVADTASNQVVEVLGGYCCSGLLGPFSINGTGTQVVNQVSGYTGFQLAAVGAGGVTESIPYKSGQSGHGIAWTPDEREVWVNNGSLPQIHVFDMTMSPPQEAHLVPVSHISHWITLSIDGRFAYAAGRKGSGDLTDVIDVATYHVVGSLGSSEDLLEIDFSGGSVVGVGNQFGIGRIPGAAT